METWHISEWNIKFSHLYFQASELYWNSWKIKIMAALLQCFAYKYTYITRKREKKQEKDKLLKRKLCRWERRGFAFCKEWLFVIRHINHDDHFIRILSRFKNFKSTHYLAKGFILQYPLPLLNNYIAVKIIYFNKRLVSAFSNSIVK